MSFLWRNRLYVVREVLDHWRERQDWWATAAARAVHGDADSAVNGVVNSAVTKGDVGASAGGVRLAMNQEREVWRVEASAGRVYGTGVYDLAREPVVGPSVDQREFDAKAAPGGWQLVRMAD